MEPLDPETTPILNPVQAPQRSKRTILAIVLPCLGLLSSLVCVELWASDGSLFGFWTLACFMAPAVLWVPASVAAIIVARLPSSKSGSRRQTAGMAIAGALGSAAITIGILLLIAVGIILSLIWLAIINHRG
jgi:hypothetical protein